MKSVLIVLSILAISQAEIRFGFNGLGGFQFSNPFFNTSYTPPGFNVAAGVPGSSQFTNPISRFFNYARPAATAASNAVNSVNNGINTSVNTAVNTAVNRAKNFAEGAANAISKMPVFGSLIAGINSTISSMNFGNLWNTFQNTVDRYSKGQAPNPSSVFDQMNQFLPNITDTMNNFVDYARTAANPEFWNRLPSGVQADIQKKIQNMVDGISNITSAMNNVVGNLPQFMADRGLNTTLRNQPFFFPGRSGIVHLFEWKFEDIALECEQVLGPSGYGGVQVSPINEYLVSPSRAWWERYQPVSFKINTRSGDEKQFSDMVQRCLRVGVRIYVDVVVNHMAAPGPSSPIYGTAGSTSDPLAREYPAVPFNKSHFHTDCEISNYNDAVNVRNCALSSLPDLDQSNRYVRERITDYLNHLIDLGVAGFRMDACKHMWPEDLKAIYDSLKPLNPAFLYPLLARPFIYQEVIDMGNEAVSVNEYTNLGVVTEFKWCVVVGQVFRGLFQSETLELLTKNGSVGFLMPSSQALVFVDNHDNQRGHGAGGENILTYKNKPQYIQAVAFTLATDYGIARVMSSYDFTNSDQGPPEDTTVQLIKSPGFASDGLCNNGWVCEHRWPEIRRMIRFRSYVEGTSLDHIQSTNTTFAFCRGEKGFIVFNNSEDTIEQTFHTCLPKGQYCDIISGEWTGGSCTGTVISVQENGDALLTLPKNSVIAIYGASRIS